MQDVFNSKDAGEYISRINKLTPETQPLWGKMSVSQMLAHCNVAYELVYEPAKHKKAGFLAKLIMKNFVKPKVVGDKPYPKNSPTSPVFRIEDEKNFEEEKKRLVGFIQKTQQLGAEAFEGKESHSFGTLTANEWNAMFAKHLNHHLSQFGV